MSACNIVLQGRRGYLLTDGAYTNDDGTIAGFGSKVLAIPAFAMAIATRGCVWPNDIRREIEVAKPVSADDLIARLPEMLLAATSIYRASYATDDEDSSIVYALHFCRRTRRAAGYIVADDRADMPASYVPFTLQPVLDCFGPGVDPDAVLGRSVDLRDGTSFDPAVDGLAIMQAQRQDPRASIGGFAELTTVSADGVSTRRIHEWPDVVGERIAA